MDFLLGLPVVIVVVCEGLVAVRVLAERPESVEVHVGAQLQRQAGHDEARAEADRAQALGAPEAGQAGQVVRAEEDGSRRTPEVLQGVDGTQGHRRVVAVWEGGEEDQGVAVGTEALHERPPALHEPSEPGRGGNDRDVS